MARLLSGEILRRSCKRLLMRQRGLIGRQEVFDCEKCKDGSLRNASGGGRAFRAHSAGYG